ncbi:MAG: hypothetical protein COB20_08325 [SAR86 cluster bacterium]|uniref:Uncharacterized protein n=1 Tax=SAR86 cluster bacterium TaxID=2030880 RepID=A0A2A4X4A9_9GAMM|nr:MAG: hypothetical protein COB20_08325 [SAR86 cluster bacterium]
MMMRNFTPRSLAPSLVFAVSMAITAMASAQIDQIENPTDDSTIVYPAAYFADFLPVSANDMVSRIPGIGLAMGRRGGNSGRGLGSGEGEILINGQRTTGKGNTGESLLSRISADQVEYIEIIRGTSEELDVRGAGQVVNVVLLDMPSRSSTSVELNVDYSRDGTLDPGGQLSYSGQAGDFNYLFALEAESNYNGRINREFSFDANENLIEARREDWVRDQTDYRANMNLGYSFEKSGVQLNALLETRSPPNDIDRTIHDFTTNTISHQREANTNDRDNWEIGGDYEYSFDSGSRYRFLFIVNDRDFLFTRERFDVEEASENKNLFLSNYGRDRERIARTSYTFNVNDTQGLELGFEGAQTIRDGVLRLGLDTEGMGSPEVGGLVPVSISNSTSTVEELRAELFAVHNWQLNSKMSLESSLVYESSTIEQSGDVGNERDFSFLRPKIDYRFDITPSLQLRAGIEKDVSQLSFSDFSATVDGNDEDQNTQAGNPGIAQEQSWRYEINLELRLPNDVGVLNSQFYYRDLEDVIDRIDVSTGLDNLQSARGNIGDGKRYGVNLDLSARLSFLGLPNALLTTGLSLRDSEVLDPFTKTKRRQRNNGRWTARSSFRHDVTGLGLSYGFSYEMNSNGGSGRTEIDIIDTEERIFGPQLSAFLEKQAFGNFTFRFEANNIRQNEFCRTRTRYVGATADGILEEVENYCSGGGMQLALKMRTTF